MYQSWRFAKAAEAENKKPQTTGVGNVGKKETINKEIKNVSRVV